MDPGFNGPIIEFQKVTFSHKGRHDAILKDVSFGIGRHEFIGIVGASGSGKSTLFDLILGLNSPDSGKIQIAGLSVEEMRKSGSPVIALVSQNTGIFNASIRTNLTLRHHDNSGVDDSELWQALRFAGLEDFIIGLPNALDTQMGELGSRFSGGQRQRMGIARAILHRPEILLLDEATSSLDAESESEILSIVQELRNKMTILSIAHRLSFVKTTDRLLHFHEGKLISEGSFSTLMESNPSFRKQVEILDLI